MTSLTTNSGHDSPTIVICVYDIKIIVYGSVDVHVIGTIVAFVKGSRFGTCFIRFRKHCSLSLEQGYYLHANRISNNWVDILIYSIDAVLIPLCCLGMT